MLLILWCTFPVTFSENHVLNECVHRQVGQHISLEGSRFCSVSNRSCCLSHCVSSPTLDVGYVTCLHVWLSDRTAHSSRAATTSSQKHLLGTQFLFFKLVNKAGITAVIANRAAQRILTLDAEQRKSKDPEWQWSVSLKAGLGHRLRLLKQLKKSLIKTDWQ